MPQSNQKTLKKKKKVDNQFSIGYSHPVTDGESHELLEEHLRTKTIIQDQKYPTKNGYQYAAFYEDWGVWWSINKEGTTSVAEDSILKYGPFFDTQEEAGAAINRHATNGGGETVWMG